MKGGGGLLGIYRIPRFDKRNYVVCKFAFVYIVAVISLFSKKNTKCGSIKFLSQNNMNKTLI